MKHAIFAGILLLACGCHQAEPPKPVQAEPQKIKIEVETKHQAPTPPAPPTVVSSSYLAGYRDGYYGNWLAPARWMVRNEYRAGWSAGDYDRTHGLPYRYTR